MEQPIFGSARYINKVMLPNTRSFRYAKGLTIAGSVLLLLMAGIHGSGYNYLTGMMNTSDAPAFIKQIFPVLFAHPSLHLLGLAAFALLTLWMPYEGRKVLFLAATLVILDGVLAFILGGVVPGILLSLAGLAFFFSGRLSTPVIDRP